jgi:hypothetical protein
VIDRVLFDWAPLVIALVVGTFFADYLLTHLGARASRRVRERWSVEGSYELNPTWERQIDSGQVVGPRVFLAAGLLAIALSLTRLLAWPGGEPLEPAVFGFFAGVMLLLQAPILMVHAANLQTFHDLLDPTAVEGGLRYRRWFIYRQGAAHLARFGVLWLLLWLPSQQAFFLGGTFSCFAFGWRLHRLGVAARAAPAGDAATAPSVEQAAVETTRS